MPIRFAKTDLGRLVFSKFTVTLLITALVMPLFLFSGMPEAKAERRRKVIEAPTVKHAPPEPFVIVDRNEANPFRTSLSFGIASAVGYALSTIDGTEKIEKKEIAEETREENNNEPETKTEVIAESESAAPLTPTGRGNVATVGCVDYRGSPI